MPSLAPELTAAAAEFATNMEANLAALAGADPELARDLDLTLNPDVEPVYARDGSLTALASTGEWWGGCSVPRRAGEAILGKADLRAPVVCFLAPAHAAHVRYVLDRLSPTQALLAIVPSLVDLRVMLGCAGFADEIGGGRLLFAAGAGWAGRLSALLERHDGLPTPGQFVRTALVDEDVVGEMIAAAQDAFAREATRRADLIKRLYAAAGESSPAPRPPAGRFCVVAPQHFRLWDDAGHALAAIAAGEGWATLNPDDPHQASPVAFARAASGCDAVVVADLGRADLPADFPAGTRVVTWQTTPRTPARHPGAARDTLIVADARWSDAALRGGWSAEQVQVATWPASNAHGTCSAGPLALITDTGPITTPDFELSSQRVLWDTIARELRDDPFAVGDDVAAYLARWCARAGISADAVDRPRFVDGLIFPAYAQGLARWLIAAGVDVALYGRGWGAIDEFAARHAGEVSDRAALRDAVERSAAIVHAWPTRFAHPIDAAGRPVLRRGDRNKELWLIEARRLAAPGGQALAASSGAIDAAPALDANAIRAALAR